MTREITAVTAALSSFDEDAVPEQPTYVEQKEAEEEDQPADIKLQRAGLEQRLSDLEGKQGQYERALEREQDAGSTEEKVSGPKEGPKKAPVLQEDRFLDEELDNARNSAMVETERDRLIRLVRQPSVRLASVVKHLDYGDASYQSESDTVKAVTTQHACRAC